MDVITIGETMALFTPQVPGPLRFNENFRRTIGGAESNVAIALARLGHQTGWISQLGNDEFGLYIRNYIRGEGVDTSRVSFTSDFPTAVFFKESNPGQDPKVFYYRKDSAASKLQPGNLDSDYIAKAKFIHLTGITPALSETCKKTIFKMIELAKSNGQTIVFDPNIRLKLWPEEEARDVLNEIAGRCDIVLPGMEEGKLLTSEKTPEKMADFYLEKGVKAVIIKLGADGAYYAAENESAYVSGYKVDQVIDTVGAGDGFAAGFLSGLIRGWGYRQAVQFGNRIGAYALSVPGDVEGYPYWEQVDPENSQSEVLR